MRDMGDTLTANELKDLEDLIAHPGWRLVETMIDREWGAVGFGQKVSRTIGTMTPDSMVTASQQMLQAVVTQAEILRVAKWPREQVAKAKQLALGRVASMNRGGV